MKHVSILLFPLLLAATSLKAQPTSSGAKTTATASRRIGISVSQYNAALSRYVVDDTTRFFFSGSRHKGVDLYEFGDADSLHFYGVDVMTGTATLNGTWIQTLDAAGNVVATHQTTADGTGFRPLRRGFHTYDASGNMLSETREEYDVPTSSYTPYSKKLYTYTSGRLTESIDQYYNSAASAYENNSREVYTYDGSGFLTGHQYFSWSAGAWQPGGRTTHTNNPAGFPTTTVAEFYVTASAVYTPWYRNLYTYDAGNRETERIRQDWNSGEGAWVNDEKHQMVYSGAVKTDHHLSLWVGGASSGSWEPEDRRSYTYDAAGNNTVSTDYNWRAATSIWAPTDRTVKTYNTFGQVVESREEKWEFAAGDFQVVDGNSRTLYSYETYEDASRTSESPQMLPVFVYPVPASRMLYVSLDKDGAEGTATLISATGAAIRQLRLENGRASIPVEGLPAGVYMLTVQTTQGKAGQRVVIEAGR